MSEATHPQSNGTLAGAAESEQQSTRPRTKMLELARPECLRLLATTSIGRVVVSVPAWDHPMIRPVNYLFDESSQSVLLRSAMGSKLHSLLRSARAAFEIDGIDHAGDVGWSVDHHRGLRGDHRHRRAAASRGFRTRAMGAGHRGPLDSHPCERHLGPTDRDSGSRGSHIGLEADDRVGITGGGATSARRPDGLGQNRNAR